MSFLKKKISIYSGTCHCGCWHVLNMRSLSAWPLWLSCVVLRYVNAGFLFISVLWACLLSPMQLFTVVLLAVGKKQAKQAYQSHMISNTALLTSGGTHSLTHSLLWTLARCPDAHGTSHIMQMLRLCLQQKSFFFMTFLQYAACHGKWAGKCKALLVSCWYISTFFFSVSNSLKHQTVCKLGETDNGRMRWGLPQWVLHVKSNNTCVCLELRWWEVQCECSCC